MVPKRILASLSSVLVPAALYQKEADLEEEMHDLLGKKASDSANSEIMKVEEERRNNADIKSHLRHGCQMAIARFNRIIRVWPFGLLDYGSATLRCKI